MYTKTITISAAALLTVLTIAFPSAVIAQAMTWDPDTTTGTLTLSDGNLTTSVTGTEIGNSGGVRTTQSVTDGKHYWEVTMNCPVVDTAGFAFGVGTPDLVLSWNSYFFGGKAWSFMSDSSRKFNTGNDGFLGDENGNFGFPDAWPRNGDVMQFALDMDSGKIWFGINCVWLPANSGADPVAGINPAYSDLPGELYATMMMASRQCGSDMSATANFGATPLTCDVPDSFNAGLGDTGPADSDGDGVPDDEDNCPADANADQADLDEDGLGDVCDPDVDGDGIANDDDLCAATAIPEMVPTVQLRPNRWALIDNDFAFDTVVEGEGKGPNRSYTTEDTAGCSCEQIIELQGLGLGHTYHGCSISAMDDWVDAVNMP